MATSHSHPQVEKLLGALKQLLRARGLRYRDIAERLGVTERTVKRWLADRGLTMNVAEDLCGVLGMSFIELCEFAKDDLDTRPQRLSREQERLLFSDLQLGLVFMLLMRGWTAYEIQRECGLPEATLVGHLVRLERIKLVQLLPGNKVRLLFGRRIEWQENGEVGRAFGRHFKNLFATMDYSNPDAIWSTQVFKLSPRSLSEVRGKFRALVRDIQQTSDADRRLDDGDRNWHVILLAARPFDPLKLGDDQTSVPPKSPPSKPPPSSKPESS
jgi:transcriptional regulator with XRE-family HTH domain